MLPRLYSTPSHGTFSSKGAGRREAEGKKCWQEEMTDTLQEARPDIDTAQ